MLNSLPKPLVLDLSARAGLTFSMTPITPVAVSTMVDEMKKQGVAVVLEKLGVDGLGKALDKLVR